MIRVVLISALVAICLATPAHARVSLGIFDDWGAFRDPQLPRCYAITKAETSRAGIEHTAFASVGTWPNRRIRNQVHFRLSRSITPARPVTLAIGGETYRLTARGSDAWAQDRRMDARIVAAMRSGARMSISATDRGGDRFTDQYSLNGVATAIDAATIGCARDN